MIELERKGKQDKDAERDESGKLPPVKLHNPHHEEATGWSPSEWRNSEQPPEEGEE